MSEILDNFNLNVDALSLSAIVKSAGQLLDRAVALQKLHSVATPRLVQPGATITEDFLGKGLLDDLREELLHMNYTSTGVNQPKVCLLGEHRYTYSKNTRNLLPVSLSDAPATAAVLGAVNSALGQREFNSVLVNRYHNKNSKLGFHRDDEPEIVQSEGIASLSLGAQRRFQIASSKEEGEQGHYTSVTLLSENSVFLMEAGFQNYNVHRVAPGRDIPAERGGRYSLTFRKLCEPGNTTTAHIRQPDTTAEEGGKVLEEEEGEKIVEDEEGEANVGPHCNCYDTIVIGSSLTRGLKELKLSERGRKFKVICRPGAHVDTIIASVYALVRDDGFCCDCVKEIFVVVGGNDTQNGNLESMSSIMDSFSTMLEVLRDCFLFSMINVFSLIPRVSNDTNHVRRMNLFNESLDDVCYFHDNVKIINVFNHFLNKKELSKGFFILNNKLFSKDGIHLSSLGNSVLAKVIIGVTYNPY